MHARIAEANCTVARTSRLHDRRLRVLPLVAACLLPACQQQMAVQPSFRPDEPSAFFADGRAARPLCPGTVARGHLRTDLHLFTGQRTPADAGRRSAAALVGARPSRQSAVGVAALAAADWKTATTSTRFPFRSRARSSSTAAIAT